MICETNEGTKEIVLFTDIIVLNILCLNHGVVDERKLTRCYFITAPEQIIKLRTGVIVKITERPTEPETKPQKTTRQLILPIVGGIVAFKFKHHLVVKTLQVITCRTEIGSNKHENKP